MLKTMARLKELGGRKEQVKKALSDLEAQKAGMDHQYLDQKIAMISQINQLDGAMQEATYRTVNLTTPPEVEPQEKLR
jgi:hypothetical protein